MKPTIEIITDIVAQEYFVSREDIFSPKRTQSVSDARQVIMYIAHKCLYMPYGEIAEYVGRSYNTTRYGIRVVKDRYLFDRGFFQKLNQIKDKINKLKEW